LGPLPADFGRDEEGIGAEIFPITAVLNRKLIPDRKVRLLKFANGEIRRLPEKIGNDWSDSLVGAQYLDFPAHSKVRVSIKVKVVRAPEEGVQLRLALKQWEHPLEDIKHDGFPLLHAREEGTLVFSFENTLPRRAFSFHLLGESKDAVVQLEQFDVSVDSREG